MLNRLHHSAQGLLSPEGWRIRIVFWAGAIIVGLLASLVAPVADYSNGLVHHLLAISPYLPLVVTPSMIMLSAWLTRRSPPGSEGGGMPQCIAALEIRKRNVRSKRLSWCVATGKIPPILPGLLSGAAIGREGPNVHRGAGGPLGGVFATVLLRGHRLIRPVCRLLTFLMGGVCSLIMTLLGLISDGATCGSGDEAARALAQETQAVHDSFPYLKPRATAMSYCCGIPGGIFAPSLATRAGLGAPLGHLFPHTELAAAGVLATVACFASVGQTSTTAFLIVMEMTHNYVLLIPLMATSFIACGASRLVCPRPIYRALAEDFLNASPAPNGADAPPAEQRPSSP